MDRRIPPANLVVIAGQLVTDPQRLSNDNGIPCTEFLMANNQTFRTSSNERREKSCFVSVVTWGVLARDCLNFLSRKSAVYVEGELESAPKSKGGKVSIRATKVEFLDKGTVREVDHADRNSPRR
jgi:single-strand DNA-binding protein